MANGIIEFSKSSEAAEVAYVSLPEHACRGIGGIVKKTVPLHDLMLGYKGANIYLDFDKDEQLIGIEIVT